MQITTNPNVLVVGDSAPCVVTETPDVTEVGGTFTWSIDGGSVAFIPTSDTECVMIANAPGTSTINVKYEGLGATQGYAEDTIECMIIDVDIDDAPINLQSGDTAQLSCIPTPDLDVTGGVLRWYLIDSDDTDCTVSGMFTPNDTGVASGKTPVFDSAGLSKGRYYLNVEYNVSGITTNDSQSLCIQTGPLDIIPQLSLLELGETCPFEARCAGGDRYDSTEVTWTILEGSVGSISANGLNDTALFTASTTTVGTCLVKCVLNADSEVYDTAEVAVANLTVEGGFAYGSFHPVKLIQDKPFYYLIPEGGKIDDGAYRQRGLLKLHFSVAKKEDVIVRHADGRKCIQVQVDMFDGSGWDAYRWFINWFYGYKDENDENYLTAERMYNWLVGHYDEVTEEDIEKGLWWITPWYTTPGPQGAVRLQWKGKAGLNREIAVVPYGLDIDSDNNGKIDGFDDFVEEYEPGCIIPVNLEGDGEGLDCLKELQLWAGFNDGKKYKSDYWFEGWEVTLTTPAGVKLWKTKDKQEGTDLPATYTCASDELPRTLYVDGTAAGDPASITLAFKVSGQEPIGTDEVKVTVTPTPCWSPASDKAFMWLPLSSTTSSFAFSKAVEKAGFEMQKGTTGNDQTKGVPGYRDDTIDDYKLQACTVEAYKSMATGGAILVEGHGNRAYHNAVYVKYDRDDWSEAKQACEAWMGDNGIGTSRTMFFRRMYETSSGKNVWCVSIYSKWHEQNFAPGLNANKAITFWANCYSADDALASDFLSYINADGATVVYRPKTPGKAVKEAAGGRLRIGFSDKVRVNTVSALAWAFFFDGCPWDRALEKLENDVPPKKTSHIERDGNIYTTFGASPLAGFPSEDPGNRIGWGCVIFDTYMNDGISASEALTCIEGGPTSHHGWTGNNYGKFILGFRFDKRSGEETTMQALRKNCRNKGNGNGRPSMEKKEWGF